MQHWHHVTYCSYRNVHVIRICVVLYAIIIQHLPHPGGLRQRPLRRRAGDLAAAGEGLRPVGLLLHPDRLRCVLVLHNECDLWNPYPYIALAHVILYHFDLQNALQLEYLSQLIYIISTNLRDGQSALRGTWSCRATCCWRRFARPPCPAPCWWAPSSPPPSSSTCSRK